MSYEDDDYNDDDEEDDDYDEDDSSAKIKKGSVIKDENLVYFFIYLYFRFTITFPKGIFTNIFYSNSRRI